MFAYSGFSSAFFLWSCSINDDINLFYFQAGIFHKSVQSMVSVTDATVKPLT